MSRRQIIEPPQVRIVGVRAQIDTLRRERRPIQEQRLDRAAVRAAVEGFAAALAANFDRRAAAVVGRVAYGDRPADLVHEFGLASERGLVSMLAGVVGPQALADAMLRSLDDRVPEGLDAETRAQRLAEIDADLLRFEVEEERIVEESEALGAPIARRADARPEVVLGDVA